MWNPKKMSDHDAARRSVRAFDIHDNIAYPNLVCLFTLALYLHHVDPTFTTDYTHVYTTDASKNMNW